MPTPSTAWPADSGDRQLTRFASSAELPLVAPPVVPDWELTSLLGSGTFCRVYRARPWGQAAAVSANYALKVLRAEWEADPQALAVLATEAQVAHEVAHPHLVAVLDSQLTESPNYLVMPYLEGITVAQATRNRRQWPVCTALWLARQVAEALQALHSAGWVHGDLKPDNLLLADNLHVTLLDLGFAQRYSAIGDAGRGTAGGAARTRPLQGSPHYWPPERLHSVYPADPRSDLYALGVMLFEWLAGELPFPGQTTQEVLAGHAQGSVPELSSYRRGIPEAVNALVLQLLAKQPAERGNSGAELCQQLRRLELDALLEHCRQLPALLQVA